MRTTGHAEREGHLRNAPDRTRPQIGWTLVAAMVLTCGACVNLPSVHTFSRDYGTRPMFTDPPGGNDCGYGDGKVKYDDIQNGGQLFKMYCGSCHNARHLAERPFAETQVAFAHMRRHAYLTGQEYRQLMHFLRRWHDIGPPTPDVEPTPKRVVYSQPISELKPKSEK